MSDKVHEKMQSSLDQMLQIIQGNENDQGTETLCLVNENGVVNDDARSRLAALVYDMKMDLDTIKINAKQPTDTGMFSAISGIEFPWSSKKVQVFLPIQTSTTHDFATALTKLCKTLSFKCEISDQLEKLRGDLPLVVVCPISSRFEPDIDYALNGISWKSPFVSLVLHSSTESSLPRLPTATRLADKEKYRNTEFIDIAFTMESKLYQCQMNTIAKEQLKSFFDRFYKK
ncbi:uncharacterized protein LOC123539184 isoform X3 [Mercenaria mercenaria]|uniref:uncharacterized protein LOC123539184 isoform X3 n=1 Tax=Mercenaria mercenaria TaxID=6596 RepID=UPI00234F3513|nr:uncharacterized protein LOC123539184 isoform X3 [Mercenaria mercenaria]